MKKTIKIIAVLILSFIIIRLSMGLYKMYTYEYSQGIRIGTLIHFSEKGSIFKTYEGSIQLEYITTPILRAPESSPIWNFSVKKGNHDIINQLKSCGKQKFRFFYNSKMKAFPWDGKTNYFVYRIEELENTTNQQ